MKVLMPRLCVFSQRYPGIPLELVIPTLTRREADITIRVTLTPPEAAVGRRIWAMPTTVYGSIGNLARQGDASVENYNVINGCY